MKKLILAIVLIITIQGIAQKRNAKHKFTVNGICEMCKERIEKACLDTKGVKLASWNVDKQELFVIINEKKTSLKKLKTNIANAGHDTDSIKTSQKIYDNMHECCKYRELEGH